MEVIFFLLMLRSEPATDECDSFYMSPKPMRNARLNA